MRNKFTMKINRMFIIIITIGFFFTVTSSEETKITNLWGRGNRNKLNNRRSNRAIAGTAFDCHSDNDCEYFERCISNICFNVCEPDSCGVNAHCTDAYDHFPICSCYDGFTGDPSKQCVRESCNTDEDCKEIDQCQNNWCTAACLPNLCGENALCYAENHSPGCVCADGYTGDPETGCFTKTCRTNHDCNDSDKCEDNRCTSACSYDACGDFELCHVENHRPVCTCKHGYSVYGEAGCVKNCRSSDECGDTEKCENNLCVDVCDDPYPCDESAWCHVKDHLPVCTDTEEYIEKPKIEIEHMDCTTINDCGEFDQCINNKCIDVCHPSPCGVNAWCARAGHNPVCFCNHGYTGNPHEECVMIECYTNKHCKRFEQCWNMLCYDVCEPNPCGANATCHAKKHRAVCKCKDGSIEPETGCQIESLHKAKLRRRNKKKKIKCVDELN